MADIVDSQTRSRMMSGIRGSDTRPEILLRKSLFALGFRYRLHCKGLAGRPDLVFPGRRAVILVHGCFWHGHDCHLFKWPSTRPEFWKGKIDGNRLRDQAVIQKLEASGWRCLTVWECALKGRTRWDIAELTRAMASWLDEGHGHLELRGRADGSC